MMNNQIKELTLLAISTSILIVQEYLFQLLPNIQLTTLLILVYTYVYGLKKSVTIVFVYVIIDNLMFGSIGMLHVVIPMLLAWQLIVVSFYYLSRYTKHILIYGFFGYLMGHIYGLMFVPFQSWILNLPMLPYLIADIPFQIIFAISNFLTIIWLFEPLSSFLRDLYQRYHPTN